jgi:hypothetical protein
VAKPVRRSSEGRRSAAPAGRLLGLRDGAARLHQHAEERLHDDQEPALPHRQRRLARRPADHPRPARADGALEGAARGDRAAAEDRPRLHLRAPSAEARLFLYSFGKVRQFIAKRYGAEFLDAPPLELHRENFKRFLRFSQESLDRTNGMRRDPHWSPQTTVLAASDRWRRPDVIGKVERFDAGMAAVFGLAGVARDFETPRMNEGPPPPWCYEEVVDDEIRALGARLFADDLKAFGYTI